ncbi:MAG: TraB/GumN family protein, partial [Spirochaetales bacterium]|nr:TraB/GumN family protein [Spirochaetales bacterium]
MKISNLFYLLLLLLLVGQSHGETSVWKISNDGKQLFIGGTIHVLSEDDYPLPVEFEQAYEQSEIIVFETDMQNLNSPEVQQAMISAVTYKGDRNLQQDLSEETYQMLGLYLMNLGIPETALNSFKPGMVAVTIT